MKKIVWHFYMPGMVYSCDLRFYKPVSEADARKELKMRKDLKRLPNNTEFW